LAVDLFRRPVDLILPRRNPSPCGTGRAALVGGSERWKSTKTQACFCTADPERTAICGTGGAGNNLDRGFVGLAEATVGIGPDLRWLFIFYYPNLRWDTMWQLGDSILIDDHNQA
jgi:hypothetical protein